MPPPIDMTRNGWDVTLQNGNLTFGIPVAVVPGEVPIPVTFGLNATFLTRVWTTRVYDPDLGKSVPVLNEIDRPAVGGVHFGYISDAGNYGGTTVDGLTVLENGNQIADSQWTTFSSSPTLGTTLNLPQAYGFSAVSISSAKVDPTATYLSYTTTAAGLGTTYQSIVQGLAPSGFGTNSTSYKVVLDKNKARVYAYAASVHAWAPVLWADRFGHYVTFQWVRSTTGLPDGITAITKVTATNQRSKGVVLRWADYTSNTVDENLLRVDFVGVRAPSVLIKGHPGYSYLHPVNAIDPVADNGWVVVPSPIGSLCRPTSIQVGSFRSLPQPSWNSTAVPAASGPGEPPGDGTSDSATRGWFFYYDTNLAELTSLTEPSGVTTTFLYTNYSGFKRGVSEARAVDLNLRKQTMKWNRTFTTPMTIKLEGWWDPDKMATPDRYHQITFPTDTTNYGNGVYQTDALMDTSLKAWSTTTYAYKSAGGLNGSLSRVQSVSVQRDGSPTITTTLGYPDSTNLQVTQQDVSVTDSGGVSHPVSSTVNTYASRWDMLEGRQLTQTVTTRYKPDGTAFPSITLKNVYDNPGSGPALLQLQKSYLDGGATGQHGTTYSYDTDGRHYIQNVHHVEGSTTVSSPNTQWVTYDSITGALASSNIANQPSLSPVLTETRSGFDKAGRPATITNAAGVATNYTYDDRGRELSVSRSGSPTVTYQYPVASIGGGGTTPLKVTVNNQVTTTDYDGFGRVIQSKTPTGIGTSGVTTYTTQTPTYDAYGRQVALAEVNPAGTSRSRTWAYDPLDRVTSQAPYVGGGTTTSYNAFGIYSKVTTTLSNQVSSTTWTDPLGQTVQVDSPDGSVTQAAYDGAGHQTTLTITPASGQPVQTRTWTYDALGRLTSKTEPETNTQTFAGFNALNQPTVVKEAAGTGDVRTRTLVFDGFGRMQSMTNGSDSLTNTYTGPNLTSAARTVGGVTVSQSFVYNGPGGRLSTETTTQPGLTTGIGYIYDATTGHLTSLSYPSGRVVGYGYDALNRVTSITNNGVALVSNIKFDDWGNRYQTQFASGTQDQWDADLTGTRLAKWSLGYVGGGPEVRKYDYDGAKNTLKSVVLDPLPLGGVQEWSTLTHDDLGRLTHADGFGITTTHEYDAFGNAITHTATAVTSPVPPAFNNFTFDPMINNQIPGTEKNQATTGWNTNLRGEATQVGAATASSTVLGLSWDGLGLVKSITWTAGNQAYLYAPSGMRVSVTDTTTSANNRKYAYTAQGLLLGEYVNTTGTPSWKRDVVYLGSQAIAEIDAGGVHELHSDHLGSPRVVTKGAGTWPSGSNGTVEGRQAFGPYGELMSQSDYQPVTGYTGHLQTEVSGLIYMRGRYYSPAWHAFVNSDQGVDPRLWNQEAYAGGSPFLGRDPSGMIIQVPEVDMQFYQGYYMMLWLAASAGGIPDARNPIENSNAESTGSFYSSLFDFGSNGYTAQGGQLMQFPSTPILGQTFELNGTTYQYSIGPNNEFLWSVISVSPQINWSAAGGGAGVWWVNRTFGGSGQATSRGISHSFVVTTNPDGTLLHTYSYGNGGSSGWSMDANVDIAAAGQALSNLGPLNFIGGADFIPDLETAYGVQSGFSSSYGFFTNNCKQNVNSLINLTIYIHYH
ncbi:RHS repeat domain-containing protein [Geothrix mesophila]|uniref:RHS repeat domain-containing protein n=1 Tax=Geothrix mesophila TaxID=2922723 RepID=UPI001FAD1CBF|nr:RHS repeat-associated core domain-containing protein [Geothrix sp. SG198]